MSAPANPVAKHFERASRATRFDGICAKCRDDRVAQLLERASEDLAACLELRTQAKEAEAIVPRDIKPRDKLIQKYVELAPSFPREAS